MAGEIRQLGPEVTDFKIGDRVCINYMITCGKCRYCVRGSEQFCLNGKMIGKDVHGGYAEYITVPTRGVYKIPDNISFEHASVMMCSSITSLHALRKTRFQSGEKIAIFGIGGLGISALQLAIIFGASEIYAVDIDEDKLLKAEKLGAIPINAKEHDPVTEIMNYTQNEGVDVALELIGLPVTIEQGVRSLARFGRIGLVGISKESFKTNPYEAICSEKEIIGCSDHLLSEIPLLLNFAQKGKLDLSSVVTQSVPLEAEAINKIHHQLMNYQAAFRTVIKP